MKKLPGRYQQFRERFPEIAATYDDISRLATEAGPLSEKTAHLIKLGMALGSGNEGAVHSHARRALEAGATFEEINHAGLLALTTLGFPRMMTGLSWIGDVTGGELGGKARLRRGRTR